MKLKNALFEMMLCVIMIAVISACSVSKQSKAHRTSYNFSNPDEIIYLPDTLREVSGLTRLDDNIVGCIQDENGILFLFNLGERTVKKQIPFGPNGDYEGLAKAGNDMYVLRSDGMLFRIENFESAAHKTDSIATGIPTENNEGLCYDQQHNRLLIASKVPVSKEMKAFRMVYAFDIASGKTSENPVYTIDVRSLKKFARDKKLDLPYKVKKTIPEPVLKFKPSAIAIHPVSKKIWLLSASDHMIFVFGPEGELIDMELLDSELFNKAEGLIFLSDGTLLVSNEGQEGKPTILRFNP